MTGDRERRVEHGGRKAGAARRGWRKNGLLLVAVLGVVTVAAHLVSRTAADVPSPAPPPLVRTADGPLTVTARLDRSAVLAGGDGVVKVELRLAGEERPGARRVPTDLVVVLDRSGSMEGEKISLARSAVDELVEQLDPKDRFALVTYADGAELTVPFAAAGEAARSRWHRQIAAVRAMGGTAMSSGLDAALALVAERPAGRAVRLVLLSDGLANQGDASFEGLTGRAAAAARRELVVTAVGVGLNFDERLMGAIADAGTGNFYYLQQGTELATVFSRELEATRETVASGLAVTWEPAAGVEVVEAAGYPLEPGDGGVTFRPGSLFAGQERRIWLTLKVPAGSPGEHPLGRLVASYREGATARRVTLDGLPQVACVASQERFYAGVDTGAWSRAVVEDDYHRLEQRVAQEVQDGRRDEALAAIRAYRAQNELMNQALSSDAVTSNLLEAGELADEVEAAFEGSGQEEKQNALSKSRQATAWDGRRAGSKKAPPQKP